MQRNPKEVTIALSLEDLSSLDAGQMHYIMIYFHSLQFDKVIVNGVTFYIPQDIMRDKSATDKAVISVAEDQTVLCSELEKFKAQIDANPEKACVLRYGSVASFPRVWEAAKLLSGKKMPFFLKEVEGWGDEVRASFH